MSPRDLVHRAASMGVQALALTDHDTIEGLAEARDAARVAGLRLIDGVEISVTWGRSTLHVIGLNIDTANAELQAGLDRIRAGRLERAGAIARSLAAVGIEGALEGARKHAKNPALPGRAHFARFLAASGCVRTTRGAFRQYLTKGKPGYVTHQWTELSTALQWIRAAGGQGVLAHPGRYDLAPSALAQLMGDFQRLGGNAIEVVAGSHSSEQCRQFAALAAVHSLGCSQGSDFHAPGEGRELGDLPDPEAIAWVNIRPLLDARAA